MMLFLGVCVCFGCGVLWGDVGCLLLDFYFYFVFC